MLKIELEKHTTFEFLKSDFKIPNHTNLSKKIYNNQCDYLESKVAFYETQDQYKL